MNEQETNPLLAGQEALLICETSQGAELRAFLTRLSRHQVVFEVYHTNFGLRTSEVLSNCKILLGETPVFSGKAVIRNLINTGTILICEAELDDSWLDFDVLSLTLAVKDMPKRYGEFLQQWRHSYQILSDFKLWVADVQTFLIQLRLWCDQIELGIRSTPAGDRLELEHEVVHGLAPGVTESLNALFARFELIAGKIDEPNRAAHHAYLKRHLHPWCCALRLPIAPFINRWVMRAITRW